MFFLFAQLLHKVDNLRRCLRMGVFFLRLALAFVTCAVINILYLRFRGDAREPETAPNEVS